MVLINKYKRKTQRKVKLEEIIIILLDNNKSTNQVGTKNSILKKVLIITKIKL